MKLTAKEKRQKEQLKTLVRAVAYGAGVEEIDEEGYWCIDVEGLGNLLVSLKRLISGHLEEHRIRWLFKNPYTLCKYESLQSTLDFLFRAGVRPEMFEYKGETK